MHMADALLSPAVGATFWAGTIGTIGYASKKLKERSRRPEDPADGGAGRLHLRLPDDQLHDPGDGVERAPRAAG